MQLNHHLKSIILPFALSTLILSACGGGNSENNINPSVNIGTGTGDPTADTIKTLESAGLAISQGFGALEDSSIDTTVNCDPSGTADVNGDVTSNNSGAEFDLAFDFNECGGVDGTLNLDGDISTNESSFTFHYSIDGVIGGNGCEVAYNGFNVQLSFDNNNPEGGAAIIDGTISGSCGEATVTCSFDNVTADEGANLEAACSCEGTGC